MAKIIETPRWTNDILNIAIGDPVAGSETGPVNQRLKILAERTRYLKEMLEESISQIDALGKLVGGINVSDALLKASNLGDVPNRAAARANLGVSAEGHSHDSIYLKITAGLSDLDDPDVARETLMAAHKNHEHLEYLVRKSMIGIIFDWPMSTPPPYALECNNALVSCAAYADLFAIIGTTCGGDGKTTFRLPDYRGVVRRGWDHGRGLDSGRAFGSYQEDATQRITGTFDATK